MRSPIPLSLVVAAVLATDVAAVTPPPPLLWSTINVCNTHRYPHKLGIRGQAPGDGTGNGIWMRFRAQYRSAHGWTTIQPGGVSGWEYAGSALFRWQQAGWTVTLTPPRAGGAYTLRGVVEFEWRTAAGKVARRARSATRGGHPGTDGADPASYSAALCRLA